MDKMMVLMVSVLIVALASFSTQRVEALSCYVCSGNLTESAGKDCAGQGRGVPTTGFTYCSTITTVIDNVPVVKKGGGYTTKPGLPTCEYTLVSPPNQWECTCTDENCNRNAVKIPSLSCFECKTANLISNGCGDGSEWDRSSNYLQQVAGCHACYKFKALDGMIKRGCSRSLYTTNTCDYDSRGSTCYCTGDLCNSASNLPISQANFFVSLIIVAFARWLL